MRDREPTPSVWAPLGDFFATSPGVNLYKALPMGMTEDGFYCYWYMPFEKGAVIELANDAQQPRQLEIEVERAPLTKPDGQTASATDFKGWKCKTALPMTWQPEGAAGTLTLTIPRTVSA